MVAKTISQGETGRVAIYALPGATTADPAAAALRRRAESWLGRAVDGANVQATLPEGWGRDEINDITVEARRYGFHGTLKAPFRLARGSALDEIEAEAEAFAAGYAPVEVSDLTLAIMDNFFALVPGKRPTELHALADAVVEHFDRFRAPASPAEIARRSPSSLPVRQRELLTQWGYPYVLDEFRFHLTITDRIATDRQCDVHGTLDAWFAESLGRTLLIDALALFTEAEPGAPFQLHSVHPFRSAVSARRD